MEQTRQHRRFRTWAESYLCLHAYNVRVEVCRSIPQNEITYYLYMNIILKVIHIRCTSYSRLQVFGNLGCCEHQRFLQCRSTGPIMTCRMLFQDASTIAITSGTPGVYWCISVYCIHCNLNPACGSGNWPTPKAKASQTQAQRINIWMRPCSQQLKHIWQAFRPFSAMLLPL